MKTFNPRIEVRMVKTDRRKELAPGTAAAERYSQLQAIDLTGYLFDGGMVQVSNSVSQPSGVWSLTLADVMVPEVNESLYALIEPQDLIEIRMAHAPHTYQEEGGADAGLPIVMRGFVTSITRRRSMAGGRPSRVIQITGHDMGKVMQILQVFYLNNSAVGDNVLAALKFFAKYAGPSEAKIMSAKDFVQLVLDKVINPYVAQLTKLAKGEKIGASIVRSIIADVSIDGAVSPYAVSNFDGGSVYQFLAQFLDIGIWNEMFLDDRPDGVYLVVRPNPFMDVAGMRIQEGATINTVKIEDVDVEEISEARTDGGVGNYFWVTNTGWQFFDNNTQKMLANPSASGDYVLFEYPNAASARYGVRKMEAETRMGPETLKNSDATPGGEAQTESDKRLAWISARRRVLAEQNKDNVILESGSMVVRGNERIKRGDYLRVFHGLFFADYYVVDVLHQFIPYQSYKTVVTFERGTGFINRAEGEYAPYLAEMNLKGIL